VTRAGLDIRELREDDLDAEFDLRHRAFGPLAEADRPQWIASLRPAIRDGRVLGVSDGPALVGSANFHDMRQWWNGRSLPMAGVAGVKVAPEQRGRGIGRAMMTELIGVIAARGYPVSVLFPVTAPIYRSLGWEIAGALHEVAIPARSLGSLLPADTGPLPAPPPLRRAGPDDAAEVLAVIGRVHEAARDCGPNTRDAGSMRDWLASPSIFAYLAPDGFLSYGWHGDGEILVDLAVAGSAETTRAIWEIVASHASMAQTVRAWLGPDDALGWLTREPDARPQPGKRWMLRLVDAAAAIAARGFPAAVELSVALRIHDAALAANSGLWILQVSGGQGALTPYETARGPHLPSAAPVRIGARGLAALYGGVPVPTLRRAGLVADGDPDADAALGCAFAGPAFMADDF
jgi:predicted acetyltransferase